MIGWLMPPIFDWPVTDEISIETFRRHFAPGMHLGRDIDIHADVEILELSVDQWVDADAADSRLKRSSRYRNAFTNLECRLLSIHGADLRILNHLGVAVTEQGRCCGWRNRDRKIGRVQVAQAVQVNLVGRSRSACCVVPVSLCRCCWSGGGIDVVLQCNRRAGWGTDSQSFASCHG